MTAHEIRNINDQKVNDYVAHSELRVPFRNIVYIGDSATDIPCMKLVNSHGGHSIGVFNPETQDKSKVYTMMEQNRIKYFTEAIYSKDSDLEKLLKNIIDMTVVTEVLEKRHFECNVEAGEYKKHPMDYRKDILINNLEDSMNYLNICTVIDELKEKNHFNEAQNLKILNTAIQNKQIKSFINEKNVKEFYCKILDNVDPESNVSKEVKKLLTDKLERINTEHRNLFITGATGSGKTYMACAFGLEACKQHLLYEEYCFERKRNGLSLLFSVKILIR